MSDYILVRRFMLIWAFTYITFSSLISGICEEVVPFRSTFGDSVEHSEESDENRRRQPFPLSRPHNDFRTSHIVLNGTPNADLIIPVTPSAAETLAASEISRYVEKITGIPLNIFQGFSGGKDIQIHIGRTQKVLENMPIDSNLAPDGFFIERRIEEKEYILVSGKTDLGTENGAYTMLEDYFGVRWYLPGQAGEYYPRSENISFIVRSGIRNPSYASRLIGGFKSYPSANGIQWASRNKIFFGSKHSSTHYLHFFNRILPPSIYADDHPEIYPVVNGERIIPRCGEPVTNDPDCIKTPYWQPVFTEPFVKDEVVKYLESYFRDNPHRLSHGLAINDNGFFDEEFDLPRYNPLKTLNSVGVVHTSNLVFEFTNDVANLISGEFPNKKLISLGYHWTYDPPDFELAPNIVPYLTYDHAMWRVPAEKASKKQHFQAWLTKSNQIGIYDYQYGGPYLVPRYYPHIIDESLKYYWDTGRVAGYIAEGHPNWGLDGVKYYLTAKLLWNTNLNVDDLLDDFYTNFFQESSQPMKHYFEKLESIWVDMKPEADTSFRQHVGSAYHRWFQSKEQFLPYDTESTATLRLHLDDARLAAQSDQVLARIDIFEKAFTHLELAAELYHLGRELRLVESITTPTEKEALFSKIERFFTLKDHRRNYYEDVIMASALLRQRAENVLDRYNLEFGGYGPALQALLRYGINRNDEQLLIELQYLSSVRPELLELKIYFAAQPISNTVINSNFEESDHNFVTASGLGPWLRWYNKADTQTLPEINILSSTESFSGGRMTRISKGHSATIYQNITNIDSTKQYLFYGRLRVKNPGGGRNRFVIKYYSETGQIGGPLILEYPSFLNNKWETIYKIVDPPNNTVRVQVMLHSTYQDESGSEESFFDDIYFGQIPE